MASLESIMLGHECVRWLSNVRSNLRSNAAAYKVRAAREGADIGALAAEIDRDGRELARTVAAIEALCDDEGERRKIGEYLAVFGASIDDLTTAVAELKLAAVQLSANAKSIASGGDVDAAADAIRQGVAEFTLPAR